MTAVSPKHDVIIWPRCSRSRMPRRGSLFGVGDQPWQNGKSDRQEDSAEGTLRSKHGKLENPKVQQVNHPSSNRQYQFHFAQMVHQL